MSAVIAASAVLVPGAVFATAGPASAIPPPTVPPGTGLHTVHPVTGNGTGNAPVEPGPAVDSPMPEPKGLAVDGGGNVYVATAGGWDGLQYTGGVVYKIDNGIITRYAGKTNEPVGISPLIPDVATSVALGYINGLATAPNGDLYISDDANNQVHKVAHGTQQLTTVAGNGSTGALVPGPATSSPMQPRNIVVDSDGNLYISQATSATVYKVDTNGDISRFAGTGVSNVPPLTVGGAPVPAATTPMDGFGGMAADAHGNVYLYSADEQIIKVDPAGFATVYAGTGTGDWDDPVIPGPATETPLPSTGYLSMNPDGELFLLSYHSEILKIDTQGVLSVVTNNSGANRPSEGALVNDTWFSHVYGIAASQVDDNLYLYEPTEGYVWRINLVDPPATPGAPTGLTAVGIAGGADVGFTAPGQAGSTPIAKYQYSMDNETTWLDFTTTGTTSVTGRITGLTPNVSQTLVVRAVNDAGGGPASTSTSVVPLIVPIVPTAPKIYPPTEPTALVATADDRMLYLSFRAPAVRGGTPLTAYQYTTDDVTWLPLAADLVTDFPSAMITGLTNGTAYTIKVRAVNVVGEGAVSAPVTATPDAKPPTPQSLSSSALSPAIQRATVVLAAGQTVTLLTGGGQPADSVVDGGVGGYRLVGSTIVFTPAPGYSGTPSGVTFRVTDPNGLSGTAVYTPTVFKPSTPSLPTINPGTGTGSGGGTVGSSGKQAVKGQLQPGQSIGLVASGQVTAASEGTTNKIPVAGEGTYQVFRSGLAFTLQFTPVAGFVGKTTGITYRISDAFGQYADATYQPVVTPAALPRIDRSKWAAIPADPKKSKGAERRTKAFNSSYRGWDAYPSTALGARVLTKNQATTLAGGTLFQGTGATLSTQGRAAVRKLVANLAPGQRVTCEGYADYASTATVVRSQSQNRAAAVCNALKSSGAKVTTSVVSYGAKRPAVIGGTAKSRTENQRVVIVVTG